MSGTTAEPRTRRPTTTKPSKTTTRMSPAAHVGRTPKRPPSFPAGFGATSKLEKPTTAPSESSNSTTRTERAVAASSSGVKVTTIVAMDPTSSGLESRSHVTSQPDTVSPSLFSTRALQVASSGRFPVLDTSRVCCTGSPRTKSSKAPSTPLSRVACIVASTPTSSRSLVFDH